MAEEEPVPSFRSYLKTALLHPRAWPPSSVEADNQQPYWVICGVMLVLAGLSVVGALLSWWGWGLAAQTFAGTLLIGALAYLFCAVDVAFAWMRVRDQRLLGQPIDDLDEW